MKQGRNGNVGEFRHMTTSFFFLLQLYKREHFVLHIWDIRPIPTIIRTVVRIVGMGRMSHICNTKCSRL